LFFEWIKDEVRLPIRMLNPSNLIQAFGKAKIQEEYLLLEESLSNLE
jgi:hypothetical protein